MSEATPQLKAELAALEYVSGAQATAERLRELLEEAMNQTVAAEQLARAEWLTGQGEPGGLAKTFGHYLGGSWDVPFAALDEKRHAVVAEINRINSFDLRKAADAADALVDELTALAQDLEENVLAFAGEVSNA